MKDFLRKHMLVLAASVALTIFVFVVLLAVVGGFVYFSRAQIFDFFASQYLAETTRVETKEEEAHEEKKEERRNVFTQEALVVDLVAKANPAVVSIVVTKDVPIVEEYFENFSPFEDFFGGRDPFFNFRFPQYRERGTEKREIGGGSGFFVSKDGLVITNKHVVADSKASYSVLTNEGKKFDATVLAQDPFLDIAVLKVTGMSFPYLSFGNSDTLKPGQTVIAIGNALGEFRNSVSVGIISGLSRSVVAGDSLGHAELLEEVIQTDAAINPGNSGGPLFDLFGRVIGVNIAVARGGENIGFALPSNLVKGVVESVESTGEIVRPYVGIRYMQVTEALKERNNLVVDYGVLVIRGETPEDIAVIPGSPADKAGILENDIILEVDGVKLDGSKSFASVIRKKKIGDQVKLLLLHKGEKKEMFVMLEKAPKDL